MNTQNKTKIVVFTILMFTLCLAAAPMALADAPTIELKSLGETSGALAKEADANIHMIMEWDNFATNKTVDFRIYNSTGKLVATPETGYVIHVTSNSTGTPTVITGVDNQGEEGEYETTYTVSGLAENIGTFTYTLKILDNSDNTTIASKSFTILVAEEEINLAVSMADADDDDIIEKDESVVFTYYVNWASVESTETHTLWVGYDDGTMTNKGSVSITSGAGSDTGTFTKVWNTEGAKSVDVELRDPSGAVVASIEITPTVGEAVPSTVSTGSSTASTTTTAPVWQNPIVIVAALAAVVAIVALVVKKE